MTMVRDYIHLCKPKVVLLMILTSLVGMCLAPSETVPWMTMLLGNIGIGMVAGAAAALNHLADQHIDKEMRRTQHRPLVKGKISSRNCIIFSTVLGMSGLVLLIYLVNPLTALLTFFSLIGYAGIYTLYLKYATPQNIVIGGIAGAAPPLLGWTAVTNAISHEALLLVLIIFVWTPPHFWALAIHRLEDYKKVQVPMLPITHGVKFTKINILLYTILLTCVSLLPYLINMSGKIYLTGTVIADLIFLHHAIKLFDNKNTAQAIKTFYYSIYYLGIIFILLLIDHYF